MGSIEGAILLDTEHCKGCRLCVVACPFDLLELAERKVNRRGYPYVEQKEAERCTGCASCAIVCPDSCITVYRKKFE